MARVRMRDTATGAIAWTTEELFAQVWEPQGWERLADGEQPEPVPAGTPPPPSPPVYMVHPDTGAQGWTTEAVFALLWQSQGWVASAPPVSPEPLPGAPVWLIPGPPGEGTPGPAGPQNLFVQRERPDMPAPGLWVELGEDGSVKSMWVGAD